MFIRLRNTSRRQSIEQWIGGSFHASSSRTWPYNAHSFSLRTMNVALSLTVKSQNGAGSIMDNLSQPHATWNKSAKKSNLSKRTYSTFV